jgi:hypothetical protein
VEKPPDPKVRAPALDPTGEIDDTMGIAIKGMDECAQGGRLAGANVTGDEGWEALVEGEVEAALDLLMTTRAVEVFGGDGFGEGGLIEAVEVIESDHWVSPPLD